jgi:hypothetical protein
MTSDCPLALEKRTVDADEEFTPFMQEEWAFMKRQAEPEKYCRPTAKIPKPPCNLLKLLGTCNK